MIGALDRIEIESVGSDPFRLAQALLVQLPHLDGRVPIEEIALALDIVAIEPKPLKSLEGCLQCDPYKSYGQIVVNANSRPRRQRYTIAHELGHFLNERHRPPSEQCFVCTAADMSALFRKDIRLNQEREANIFAIEVLATQRLLTSHLKQAAELDHVLEIADRFDISREAAARRYVSLHRECLAVVLTHNGIIRYIDKGEGFPMTSVWVGDSLPDCPSSENEALTSPDEVDPGAWLTRPNLHTLYAQTLRQKKGYAITLLIAEQSKTSYEHCWDVIRFGG